MIYSDNTAMTITIDLTRNNSALAEINERLGALEKDLHLAIGEALANEKPGRDPGKCDKIFGIYTDAFLRPCVRNNLTSRAAVFGTALVRAVLGLEQKFATEFHKGALFHDAGIAHFLCGNVDEYEYLLAMADEENLKTAGGKGDRGLMNLQKDALTAQTITERMQCACDLLNGTTTGHVANFNFITGLPPITPDQLDKWRQQLHPLEQFEFLRIIHEVYQFFGLAYPEYESVKDNPFVMLRLAKSLSHLAQWIENMLTRFQKDQGFAVKTLAPKLQGDPNFGARLVAAAGGNNFPGPNPQTAAAVNAELQTLLTALAAAHVQSERHWRTLRMMYIVRNSTAHTIEPALAMYSNRVFVVNLIQVVFLSAFVICQLKRKPMP